MTTSTAVPVKKNLQGTFVLCMIFSGSTGKELYLHTAQSEA